MGLMICEALLCILVFFAGACVFSFLNVIVYRVPKKMSFIKGRSVCPACSHDLGAADLIPIFSYIFLKGKCRYCSGKIGVRDTLTEAAGGAAALFCALYYGYYGGDYVKAVLIFAFAGVLTVVALMDIDTMEIADGCSAAIVVLAVAGMFLMREITIGQRLIGMICISVPMLLLAIVIPGAFGGGDIKLMAAGGLFLGGRMVLASAVFGILLGGGYGIYLLASKKKGRKEQFAFGPFLCAGMILGLLWGNQMIDWYLGILI